MQDPVNLLAPPAGVIPTALLVLALLAALPIYFIIRFLRAYERRARRAPDVHQGVATVAALEEELSQLRTEVAHLAEAHDFTTQLLEARAAEQAKAAGSPHSDTPLTSGTEGANLRP